MIVQLRQGLADELVRGTLDKWGQPHDDEKRTTIFVLDHIILHAPSIHRDYEALLKAREAQLARAGRSQDLHSDDRIEVF